MTTTWRELALGGELGLGHAQARGDLVVVVGAAADQARAQGLERRRRDEDLHRLGQRRAHLAGPLELDLEHDRVPRRGPALELGAQGAVAAVGVDGVLDEVTCVDATLEI